MFLCQFDLFPFAWILAIPLFNDATLESSFLSSLTTDVDASRDTRVTTFKCRLVFWGSGPRWIPFRIRDTTDRLSRRLARLLPYVCDKEWWYLNYVMWKSVFFKINITILFWNIVYFWKNVKSNYGSKYEYKKEFSQILLKPQINILLKN